MQDAGGAGGQADRARAGVVHRHGAGYLIRCGGMGPEPRRRAPGRLSLAEREEVSRGLAAGQSIRAIALALGRAPSTISREVNANGGRRRYRAARADRAAWSRATRPKQCKLAGQAGRASWPATRCCVPSWKTSQPVARPPQQIDGWLMLTYSKQPGDAGVARKHLPHALRPVPWRAQAVQLSVRCRASMAVRGI